MDASSPASEADGNTEATSAVPAEEAAAITIADFEFQGPDSVAPGAEVTVTNEDSTSHTVTADEGSFDVTVEGGATATFTAPSEPGSYDYVCNFHGDMTGTLVVK